MGSKSSAEELEQKAEELADSRTMENDTHNVHAKRDRSVQGVHVDVIQDLIQDLLKNKHLGQEHAKLRAAKERLSDLFDFAPVGYVTINGAGTVEEINLTGAEMLGTDKRRLVGKPFSDFITSDTANTYALHLKRLSANKEKLSCELKLERRDGTTFYIQMDSTGIHDDGELIEHRSTFTDISDRKQAEEELNRIFELSPDLITIADVNEGYFKRVNPAWKIFGHPLEEFTSRPFNDFIHPDDQDATVQEIKGQLSGKSSFKFVNRYRCKNGSYKTLEWNATEVQADGTVYAIARDITEHLIIQAQLQQSLKMEAIGTLSGGIAHDFNNILGIIVGNTELAIQDVPEWNPASENLKEIQKASMRARDMVKQILAFGRQSDSLLIPTDIGPIIEETLKMLRSSIPTTIEIRQDVSDNLDTINGDPTQISQILLNLCTNASHSMKEAGGALTIKLDNTQYCKDSAVVHHGLAPGNYVKLTVSDTGLGIAPDVLAKIFDPYFTTKDVGEGSGMGLSVVHGIVKNHGGTIAVTSEVGKGTTFEVLLPTMEEKRESQIIPQDVSPRGDEHILFVDDEPAMTKIYKAMLERLGYTVSIRTSSIEALEAFKAQPDKYDLVITDQTMPHLTGQAMAGRMMATRPDIPIILCTGHSDLINEDGAKEMGIQAFVMKPIAMREIANTIRDVLERRKR